MAAGDYGVLRRPDGRGRGKRQWDPDTGRTRSPPGGAYYLRSDKRLILSTFEMYEFHTTQEDTGFIRTDVRSRLFTDGGAPEPRSVPLQVGLVGWAKPGRRPPGPTGDFGSATSDRYAVNAIGGSVVAFPRLGRASGRDTSTSLPTAQRGLSADSAPSISRRGERWPVPCSNSIQSGYCVATYATAATYTHPAHRRARRRARADAPLEHGRGVGRASGEPRA